MSSTQDAEVIVKPTVSIRSRIARMIAGGEWPVPTTPAKAPSKETTAAGTILPVIDRWSTKWFRTDSDRMVSYRDYDEIDDTVDEASNALDILAQETVGSPEKTSSSAPFVIEYPEERPSSQFENIVNQVIENLDFTSYLFDFTRRTVKYGDEFQQIVLDDTSFPTRFMGMPPESMYRNNDETGFLSGPQAFTQRDSEISPPLATFYPWQMVHLRYRASNHNPYGRALLYTARTSWRKWLSMEEALIDNWLTRAFARLLYYIDTTGMNDVEARDAVRKFKNQVADIETSDDPAQDREQGSLSVVRDIYVGKSSRRNADGSWSPSNTSVDVMDTSNAGFQNIEPVEYFRGKFLMNLRVLPSYLYLASKDDSRSDTVQKERAFARYVNYLRQTITPIITKPIYLALILRGYDPMKYPFVVSWPASSILDELDKSSTMFNYARAASVLRELQAIDPEFAAMDIMKMTPAQWKQVEKRIKENPPVSQLQAQAALNPTEPTAGGGAGQGRPSTKDGDSSVGADDRGSNASRPR
jgi:hypothetical protein